MALSPITIETIAQELPVGYTVPLAKLFTTSNAEGLPITEYMVEVNGSASIALNGATDLATAAQIAAGEIVVTAGDLAKLTITPTANSGIADLYIAAYDGVTWSTPTGEALTITTNPSAVSATPGLVMMAGSSIAATALFSVSGHLDSNPNTTAYTLDPSPTAGVIYGNGAYNESTTQYAGTFEVKGSELNFLTYQAPATPGYYNFVINVLPDYSGSPWSDWEQVNVTVTGPATSAAAEIASAAAGKPLYAAYITDSAANVFANLDALQANLSAGILYGITLTDQAMPVEQVAAAQFFADRGVIAEIAGTYSLSITGMSAAQAATLLAPSSIPDLTSISVSDSAATLVANLDALQGVASADHLNALIATDSVKQSEPLSAAQIARDATAVSMLSGVSLAVSGSATQIGSVLDVLQTQAEKSDLGSVTLSDGGTPDLAITAAQLSFDSSALDAIVSPYTLTVSAGSSSVTITGPQNHATTVQFAGDASNYSLSAANGVVTVVTGSVTDHLSNVAALEFSDVSDIVAQTPGTDGVATTGNIAELYAAVLGREPDVAGLAFYQAYLQNNPTTSLLQFAEWFLSSAEYSSNPAHAYAESAAGDTQFIEDSYQNLLHRTPTASEVAFYENKVLAPAVAGLTAGTQAYAAAQFQAHAQMLVYFSAAPEFLTDVQITATNPASAQHWLLLTA